MCPIKPLLARYPNRGCLLQYASSSWRSVCGWGVVDEIYRVISSPFLSPFHFTLLALALAFDTGAPWCSDPPTQTLTVSQPLKYQADLLTAPAPTDLTVWEWLFESKAHSTILRQPLSKLAGYTNAITKERRNYAEVKECATHISTALVKKYGMKPGETVLLFSQNTIWYPITMLAAIRAGGKVCGASPAYGPEEMSFALKVAQAKFLFTVPSSIEVASKAAREAGIPQSNIFLLEGTVAGYTTVQDLIKVGQSYGTNYSTPYSIPAGQSHTNICGFLCFTSGTSGLPKAVMLSHGNLIAQALQLRQINPPNRGNVMAVLPMFHITGLVRFCITPISDNAEVVLLPSFSMKAMLDTIVEYVRTREDTHSAPGLLNPTSLVLLYLISPTPTQIWFLPYRHISPHPSS
jgi:hypothetical protein